MSATVSTVGYEGRSWQEFLALLLEHEIEVLVDVRRWPYVRGKRSPFNRNRLGPLASEAGLEYYHLQALGNAEGAPRGDWVPANEALREPLLALLRLWVQDGTRVALMCKERAAADCHRSKIAEEAARRTGASVEHL